MAKKVKEQKQIRRMKIATKYLGGIVEDGKERYFNINGNGLDVPKRMPRYMVLGLTEDYDLDSLYDAALADSLKRAGRAVAGMLSLTSTGCIRIYDLDTGLYRHADGIKVTSFSDWNKENLLD